MLVVVTWIKVQTNLALKNFLCRGTLCGKLPFNPTRVRVANPVKVGVSKCLTSISPASRVLFLLVMVSKSNTNSRFPAPK